MNDTSALSRRELMGTAAAAGLAAGAGLGAARAVRAATRTPVVSVHLDVPYVSTHGAGPYSPPIRSAAEAGLADPHELF